MNIEQYNYVVVEGPIAAGKTALVNRLAAKMQADMLLEQPADNPFLERFYRNGEQYALPVQMSFLFQRITALQQLAARPPESSPVVSDYLLDKDALFARLTLPEDELQLYQRLYDHLRPRGPVPDLVIYLQSEPATLIERIRQRDVDMEANISHEYIEKVSDSYSRFFYDYEAAPLLIVNTEHLDLVSSEEDFSLLLDRIRDMRGRREFFNRGE